MTSPVYRIKILDDTTTMQKALLGVVGQPLAVMPRVAVYDSDGLPLKGKRVVAFAWPESIFNPVEGSYSFSEGLKFMMFKNAVSPPTDASGATTFVGLTVLGYTYKYGAYLHFAVDGVATAPYIENLGIRKGFPTPPHFFMPLVMATTVSKVDVLIAPPDKAVEGVPFTKQPRIRVLNKDGKPLKDKLVIAIKIGSKGEIDPPGYTLKTYGETVKQLIYPIPGTYSSRFTNPMYSYEFLPRLTDANGYVTFEKLGFSTAGFSGQSFYGTFTIAFVCDSVRSKTFTIQVSSTVAYAEFLEEPPEMFDMDPFDSLNLALGIRMLNSAMLPIPGKIPRKIEIVPKNASLSGALELQPVEDGVVYGSSRDDGVVMIPLMIYRFNRATALLVSGIKLLQDEDPDYTDPYYYQKIGNEMISIEAKIGIVIDDFVLYTPYINFILVSGKRESPYCALVNITNDTDIFDIVRFYTITFKIGTEY